MRNRYYSPEIKRFINRDVVQGNITEPQTFNRYAYVNGDPVSYIDPFGLERELADRDKQTIEIVLDGVQLVLDVAGLIPVAGEVADGINAVVYLIRGDYVNASLSAGVMIPIAGWGTTGTKFYFKASKYFDDAKSFTSNVGSQLKSKWNNIWGKVKKKVEGDPCHCFTSGTKVITPDGEKSIEDIQLGDKVLAKDIDSGIIDYKEVDKLFQREVFETWNITVGSEVLTTTEEHPFFIKDKGWVKAKDIVIGDLVETSEGENLPVEKIAVKQEHKKSYNFTFYNIYLNLNMEF